MCVCVYVHGVFRSHFKEEKKEKMQTGRPDCKASKPKLYIENYTLVCQCLLTQVCNTGMQRVTHNCRNTEVDDMSMYMT